MSIHYRNDSPNPKLVGKRLISTTALIRKQAGLRLELAEASKAGHKAESAELRRRVAVCGVRLAERIVSVD